MKIQITIQNEFGEFLGEVLEVSGEQYSQIIELSRNFYNQGFELVCENGDFTIFPPEIVKKSILKIAKV